jgi:predicted RNase H-like HicB family nuclease
MTYSITLERGANGTYLAWVDDLPGCAVRAPSRAEVLEKLPGAINEFVAWTGQAAPEAVEIEVVEEVESAIEADEDTEVLISADRAALTEQDWSQLRESLAKSRSELVALLAGLADDELESKREESERTVREEIEHVAFVELMYAMWTFDLRSREGLAEFLSWTRKVSEERMQQLAAQGATDLTWAEWAGAPRPEPWTARKAARRLLWHELLHLRALGGLGRRP